MIRKIAIVGSGGFAREVAADLRDHAVTFFVDDQYITNPVEELPLSKLNISEYVVLVAVGDPKLRASIVERLPVETEYYTHISKHAVLLDSSTIEIGEGSIICAGVVITTNVQLGKHSQLNLGTTIGHDCNLGNYFTTAPGVKVSGNVIAGNRVYLGTNATVRQKLYLVDECVIGMQAAVVKNIIEPGVYTGVPAKKSDR
jgi:sugar O-acyltransferase (sialic acid O-acetyltransferase NeuD family)